jgi:hypothetical protein
MDNLIKISRVPMLPFQGTIRPLYGIYRPPTQRAPYPKPLKPKIQPVPPSGMHTLYGIPSPRVRRQLPPHWTNLGTPGRHPQLPPGKVWVFDSITGERRVVSGKQR